MRFSVQGTRLANDSPLSPHGRFSRLSYAAWTLMSSLFFLVACGTLGFGMYQMSHQQIIPDGQFSLFSYGIIGSLYAFFLYYNFIFIIRRLHDRNQSGWLSLLYLVPVVNLFFMAYLLCARGNRRLNDFGPKRYACSWERVLGWIYMILIPMSFMIALVAAFFLPSHEGPLY